MNSTKSNLTTHSNHFPHYNTIELIQLISLSIILGIGTLGNQIVVYIFGWKKRRRRKPFESLLLILAIFDIFESIVTPSAFIYATATHFQKWHFGYAGCKVLLSFGPANITISQGILVLISYERYRMIANPYAKKMPKDYICIWLICTTFVSILLVAPYTYSLEVVSDTFYHVHTCTPSPKKFNAFYINSVGNTIRDFAASISMAILGKLTVKKLIQNSRHFRASKGNIAKPRKMLLVVICVFSLCVIPLDMFQVIVYSLYQDLDVKHWDGIILGNTCLHILQMSNSAANIFIYSKMHKDFIKGISRGRRKVIEFIGPRMGETDGDNTPFLCQHMVGVKYDALQYKLQYLSSL